MNTPVSQSQLWLNMLPDNVNSSDQPIYVTIDTGNKIQTLDSGSIMISPVVLPNSGNTVLPTVIVKDLSNVQVIIDLIQLFN